ncbi:MAG: nucleotide exchange factor GrpE [Haloarculaceae archaeon]
MSEQDATEADGPDGESDPTADSEEKIEDIAEEPATDPEDALDEIAGNGTAGRTDNGESSATASDEDTGPGQELVERVANSDPEDIARELDTLRSQLDAREEEIEDLTSRLKRKQADFQNYKKRQKKRLEDEKERATEDLVERLLDVRDNLRRALEQDENTDIRNGVESTLKQFDEQFERENVTPIEPDPGADVDPKRHEALATIAAEQPENTVAEVHRPGYEMAGKVIRPAQVAVSDGSQTDE